MKALVTGIAGFTGRYLAQVLAEQGVEVAGISHHGASVPYVDRIYAADAADQVAIRDIVERERPDFVVHLAAISLVVHGDVAEIYRTNIMGTRNLLSALAELDTLPRAVLIASSSNVYGNRHEGIMSEDLRPDPVNDYSVSKVASEMVARLFSNRLPIIIARPFNYTGVGQSSDFLIPKIISHARSRERTIKLGNLDVARDFSDVRFVCHAYCALLQCEKAIGQVVNVSSGKAYQLSEILGFIADIIGYELKVEVDPSLVRDNEVKCLWGDSARLDGLIGAMKRIDIRDTLRWMIASEE